MVKLSAGGAASGALSGATIGANFGGPWGAAIGGGIGGLAGLLGGADKKAKQTSTLDPQQRQLLDDYMMAAQKGQGPLADLFGQTDQNQFRGFFERSYANPALERFREEIIPEITGQFRGQGLENSSYLGGALAKEGGKVQRNLDDQFANLQFQQSNQNMQNKRSAIEKILGMQTFAQGQPQKSSVGQFLDQIGKPAGQLLANKLSDGNFQGFDLGKLFGKKSQDLVQGFGGVNAAASNL